HRAVPGGAAAEGQVARRHQDQVAGEGAVGQLAAGVHGRLEVVVGAEGGQGGGAGVHLRDRRRDEQLVGVEFVDRIASLGVDGEEAPVGLLVVGPVDDRRDPGRERVVGPQRGGGG